MPEVKARSRRVGQSPPAGICPWHSLASTVSMATLGYEKAQGEGEDLTFPAARWKQTKVISRRGSSTEPVRAVPGHLTGRCEMGGGPHACEHRRSEVCGVPGPRPAGRWPRELTVSRRLGKCTGLGRRCCTSPTPRLLPRFEWPSGSRACLLSRFTWGYATVGSHANSIKNMTQVGQES